MTLHDAALPNCDARSIDTAFVNHGSDVRRCCKRFHACHRDDATSVRIDSSGTNGGAPPSSTRSTPAPSPTPTATAWATSPASPRRLGALADLGVDAIWLSPFFTSPQNDAGYDVADYCDVDPLFGTLADFDAMLAAAHARGIRVIVDLVPNHSSDEHAWFQAALAAAPGSAERAPLHVPRRHGRERRAAAEQLGVRLRRPRLDARHRGRRHARPVVPAPLRQLAARLRLDEPRGARGVPRHPAVLARPRRRRLPRRRRPRHDQGRRPARLHARRRTPAAWAAAPPPLEPDISTRAATVRRTGRQDGVHEIYRDWHALLDEYARRAHPRRRGLGRPARQASRTGCAPTRCTRRSTSPTSRRRGTPPALRTVIDDSLAAFGAVGAPGTWVLSNHDVVRHATRLALTADEPAGSRHRPATRRACPTRAVGLRRARAATALMLALPGSRLPLPGRGARPARGHRPARRRPPGPDLVPHRRRALRPRRMPRADPVGGRRAVLRLRPDRRPLAAPARGLGGARPRPPARRRPDRRSSSTARRCACAASTRSAPDRVEWLPGLRPTTWWRCATATSSWSRTRAPRPSSCPRASCCSRAGPSTAAPSPPTRRSGCARRRASPPAGPHAAAVAAARPHARARPLPAARPHRGSARRPPTASAPRSGRPTHRAPPVCMMSGDAGASADTRCRLVMRTPADRADVSGTDRGRMLRRAASPTVFAAPNELQDAAADAHPTRSSPCGS